MLPKWQMTFLLLLGFRLQNVTSNEQQRFFDITDAELPGHYTNLLFGTIVNSEKELLYRRIVSFLLTRVIHKKWEEICDAVKATRGQGGKATRKGRDERNNKKKTAAAAIEWTQEKLEELKKLIHVELPIYYQSNVDNNIELETVERIAEIWSIFKDSSSDSNEGQTGNSDSKTQITVAVETSVDEQSSNKSRLLWASLNMEAIKPLLLRAIDKKQEAPKNELIEAFEQHFFRDEVVLALLVAKNTMRKMLGQRMFAELELQEPVLLGLGVTESPQFEKMYKQVFSASMQQPNELNEAALLELEIGFVFDAIVYMTNQWHDGSNKFAKEVRNHWDKNVAKLCPRNGKISKESLVKVLDKLKGWYKMLAEHLNSKTANEVGKYIEIEEKLLSGHGKTLDDLYRLEGSSLRQFLNETPGARARVHKFLGPYTPDALLHFDLDESAMMDQLATNYIAAVSDKSSLKRLKALVTVNVLIQQHWLDVYFLAETTPSWNRYRDIFLLFVDQFIDANQQHMLLYGTLCNNLLFGLILDIEANEHEKIQRQLTAFSEMRGLVRDNTFGCHKADPLFVAEQELWLPKEHLKMLEILIQQRKEDSEAVKRLLALNPAKVKKLAELLTGKNADQEVVNPEVFVELLQKGREWQPTNLGGEGSFSNNKLDNNLHEPVGEKEEVKQPQFKQEFKEEDKVTKETKQKTQEKVDKNDQGNLPTKMEIGPKGGLTKEDSKELAEKYMQLLAEKSSEMQRLRAHTAVDIMVQLHWLDNKFAWEQAQRSGTSKQLFPKNRMISLLNQSHTRLESERWMMARDEFVIFLKEIEENGRQDFVQNYSILFNNLLFKLVNGKESFFQLMDMLDHLVRTKESELAGQTRVVRVRHLDDEQRRAEWMANEHREMLERLRAEGRIRDLKHNELKHLVTFIGIDQQNEQELASLKQIFGNRKEPEVEKKKGEEVCTVNPLEAKEVKGETNADEEWKRKGKEIMKIAEEKFNVDDERILNKKEEKSEGARSGIASDINENEAEKQELPSIATVLQAEPSAHSVLLECPAEMTDERSVSSSDQHKDEPEPYVRFLSEPDMNLWRRDVDIGALSWMIINTMAELLLTANKLHLGDNKDGGSRVKEELAQVMKDWEQLLSKEIEALEKVQLKTANVEGADMKQMALMKERNLCRFHAFFCQRILDNKVLAGHGGKNWKEALLRVGFKQELTDFLRMPDLILDASSCVAPEHAAAVVTRLLEYPERSFAHFAFLDSRIRKSEPFRRFLCSNQPNIKDRLLELVDTEALASLELSHPAVLKIEEMHPKVRIHFYNEFMKHQSDTEEAMEAEMRIAVPLLVQEIKKLEHEHNGFEDKAVGQAVREKARWLRFEVFRDHKALVSLASVCLLETFIVFASVFQVTDNFFDTSNKRRTETVIESQQQKLASDLRLSQVRQWNGAGCEKKGTQFQTFYGQRERFQKNHHTFIVELFGQYFQELPELGMRARLKNLDSELDFNYDWESYTNAGLLQGLLDYCLLADNEQAHLVSLLAVRFILWAHFMDAQLEEKSELAAVEGKVWKDNREKLLEKLEELFDMSYSQLKGAERVHAKMQVGFTNLFLMQQKFKFKKSTAVEAQVWTQRKWKETKFDELAKGKCVQWDQQWNEGEYMRYMDWTQDIASKALLQFLMKPDKTPVTEVAAGLTYNEHFRAELKQGFNDQPGAKLRLPNLIGPLGVKPVALALGLRNWKLEDFGITELKTYEEGTYGPTIPEASSSRSDTRASKDSSVNKKEEKSASSESKAFAISGERKAIGVKTASKKKQNKTKIKAQTHEPNSSRHSDSESTTPKTVEIKHQEKEFSEPESPKETSKSIVETKRRSNVSKNKKKGKEEKSSNVKGSAPTHSGQPAASKPAETLGTGNMPQERNTDLEIPKELDNKRITPAKEAMEVTSKLDANFSRTKTSASEDKLLKKVIKPPTNVVPDSTLALEPGWELSKASKKSLKVGARKTEKHNSEKKAAAKHFAEARGLAGQFNKHLHPNKTKTKAQESSGIVALDKNMSGAKKSENLLETTKSEFSSKSNSETSISTLGIATKATPTGIQTPTTTDFMPPINHQKGANLDASGTLKLAGKNEEESEQLVNPSRSNQARTNVLHPKQLRPPVNQQKELLQRADSSVKVEDLSSHSKLTEMSKASELQSQIAGRLLSVTSVKTKTIPEEQVKAFTTEASKNIVQRKAPSWRKAAGKRKLQIEVAPYPPPGLVEMIKKESAKRMQTSALTTDPIEALRIYLEQKGASAADPSLVEPAVENLKRIVHNWSNWANNVHWLQIEFGINIKEAILLFTGSYLLDLHTADSDIDCVVLLPYVGSSDRDWELLYKRFFFGDEMGTDNQEVEVLCDLVSRHCTNWSLYCMLCVEMEVTSLIKMKGRDQIPMITVNLQGFDFDLLFVTMPMHITDRLIYEFITDEFKQNWSFVLSSLLFVDQMIASFIDWIDLSKNDNCKGTDAAQGQRFASLPKKDSRKGMLLALSGYRANLLIKNLTIKNDIFKMAFLALKLWAKNHFIYGGKFGFLNGTTLTMLLLQVFLKYSSSSVPNLLLHFFNTFSTWKWPDPVKLDQIISQRAIENSHYYSSLDWQGPKEEEHRRVHFWLYSGYYYLEEHAKLVWPVIVPGFPNQNAAFNVNAWTKQAMEREFVNGLEKMKTIQEGIRVEQYQNLAMQWHWSHWLDREHFHEKYDHFVAIFCAAQSADQLHIFCDYVESRIRLQLLFTFGDPKSQVKWMHANPERVSNGSRCPPVEEANLIPAGNNWLCSIWLVGVQMVEGTKQEEVRKILEQKLEKFDSVGWNEAPKKEERSRLEDFPHKIIKSLSFKRQGSFTSSPRGSAESSRGSPSNSDNSPKTPSPSHISSTEVVEEKLWTKYLAKEQLQEWLQ